jgi:hypothetical protein
MGHERGRLGHDNDAPRGDALVPTLLAPEGWGGSRIVVSAARQGHTHRSRGGERRAVGVVRRSLWPAWGADTARRLVKTLWGGGEGGGGSDARIFICECLRRLVGGQRRMRKTSPQRWAG